MRRITVLALAIVCLLGLAVTAVAGERLGQADNQAPAQLEAAAFSGADDHDTDEHDAYEPEEPEDTRHTLRFSGEDRYATAANLADFWWGEEEVFAVYLATGETFADALATGTSHMGLGPLLLTRATELPDVTATMISRLQPCMVVAIGGPNAISDEVLQEADALTEGLDQPDCRNDTGR